MKLLIRCDFQVCEDGVDVEVLLYAGDKGKNAFVHATTKDMSFYNYEDIICQLARPPTATNNRYMSLDESDFVKVQNEMDYY